MWVCGCRAAAVLSDNPGRGAWTVLLVARTAST
jgi:hypothetical protein